MTSGRTLLALATVLFVGCAVTALDLQTSVLNVFNGDIQAVTATANGQIRAIRQLGKRLNSTLRSITKDAKVNQNTALLTALPAIRTSVNVFINTALNDTRNQLDALNASLIAIQNRLTANTAFLDTQRQIFLSSVNDSTIAGGNGRLCAQHYYDSFEAQELAVYQAMGNAVSAAMGALATAADKTRLMIAMADSVLTNHVANFGSPYWTADDATLYFNTALGRLQLAAGNLASGNAAALATAMQTLGTAINPPNVNQLTLAMRNLMSAFALCSRMPWPGTGK